MSHLSILFLTTILPDEGRGQSGGEIVTNHIVAAMRALGHDVRLLGYGRPGYQPKDGEQLVECRPIETRVAPWCAMFWLIRALLNGRAYSVEKFVGRAYRNALSQVLGEKHWDYVILDHAQMAWLLPCVQGLRLVHMSHNHETALYLEQAGAGHLLRRLIFEREACKMDVAERSLADCSHSVWTLTMANAEIFTALGAKTTVSLPVPPMTLPKDFCCSVPEYDIGLLGTWSWGPNRSGLDWFCNHVLPLLPKDINIALAGAGADDLQGRFSNLSVLGRIPDAAAFLGKVRCIAVPAIAGNGIQIKTLDAIAIGRPIVATGHALRGIDSIPPRVWVANNPLDFSNALQEILSLQDEWVYDDWGTRRQEVFIATLKEAL